MPIQITCVCGKQLQVGEEFANQQGKCPVCGRLIDIPSVEFSEAIPKDRPELRERISAEPIDSASAAPRIPSEIHQQPSPEIAKDDWLLTEDAAQGEPAPSYTLYSPGGIGLAGFLGGPFGGAIVMAINYRRLGKRAAFWIALMVGLISVIMLLTIAFALPDTPATYLIGPCVWIATFFVGKGLQGHAYDAHIAKGGEKASNWGAAGLSLLGLVVVFATAIGMAFCWDMALRQSLGHRMVFGNENEIFYQSVSKQKTRALGEYLRQVGYFTDQGYVTVRLQKEGERFVISFILQPGLWNDRATINSFRAFRDELSHNIFDGAPVVIQLCDEFLSVKKTLR